MKHQLPFFTPTIDMRGHVRGSYYTARRFHTLLTTLFEVGRVHVRLTPEAESSVYNGCVTFWRRPEFVFTPVASRRLSA